MTLFNQKSKDKSIIKINSNEPSSNGDLQDKGVALQKKCLEDPVDSTKDVKTEDLVLPQIVDSNKQGIDGEDGVNDISCEMLAKLSISEKNETATSNFSETPIKEEAVTESVPRDSSKKVKVEVELNKESKSSTKTSLETKPVKIKQEEIESTTLESNAKKDVKLSAKCAKCGNEDTLKWSHNTNRQPFVCNKCGTSSEKYQKDSEPEIDEKQSEKDNSNKAKSPKTEEEYLNELLSNIKLEPEEVSKITSQRDDLNTPAYSDIVQRPVLGALAVGAVAAAAAVVPRKREDVRKTSEVTTVDHSKKTTSKIDPVDTNETEVVLVGETDTVATEINVGEVEASSISVEAIIQVGSKIHSTRKKALRELPPSYSSLFLEDFGYKTCEPNYSSCPPNSSVLPSSWSYLPKDEDYYNLLEQVGPIPQGALCAGSVSSITNQTLNYKGEVKIQKENTFLSHSYSSHDVALSIEQNEKRAEKEHDDSEGTFFVVKCSDDGVQQEAEDEEQTGTHKPKNEKEYNDMNLPGPSLSHENPLYNSIEPIDFTIDSTNLGESQLYGQQWCNITEESFTLPDMSLFGLVQNDQKIDLDFMAQLGLYPPPDTYTSPNDSSLSSSQTPENNTMNPVEGDFFNTHINAPVDSVTGNVASSHTSPSDSNLSSIHTPDNMMDPVEDDFLDRHINELFNPISTNNFLQIPPSVITEQRSIAVESIVEASIPDPPKNKNQLNKPTDSVHNRGYDFVGCTLKTSSVDNKHKVIKHRISKPSQIECPDCRKQVLRKNISSHRKTHYEKREKNQRCDQCNSTYFYSKDLRRHQALKHGAASCSP